MANENTRLASRSTQGLPLVPDDVRTTMLPLAWLIAGVLLSFNYCRFSGSLLVHSLPLPLYPQQGVILAVLLLTPPRRWWLYLGVYYVLQVSLGLISPDVPVWYITLSNVGNVIEPLLGAYLL